jgi:HTH-type transcriptional regulator, sugar sensing transcriptional regulator
MSNKHHEHLKSLGFTEKEAKVYMTCLKNGACTVKRISEDCGVKRPTTYVMLKSLMEKELVSLVKRGKKTFFVAAHPEALAKHVQREKESIIRKEQAVAELLPMLLPIAAEFAPANEA